ATRASQRQAYSGYPALYGRFQGTTRAGEWTPPASTLALNPYSRPQAPARAGDLPHGAQLLSTVRQAPGGGRDLYASPDGNVYRRQKDGWYRRQAGGGWNFVAPLKGSIERGQGSSSRGAAAGAGGNVYRPVGIGGPNVAPGRGQGLGPRVPNSGFEARAQDVAALEREYYARSLAQFRADNWRSGNSRSRPARGALRRR